MRCRSLSSCLQKAFSLIELLSLRAKHLPAIEILLDQRFGPARRNRTAYRLRDGVDYLAGSSMVAMAGDNLVGSVQCWPVRVRGANFIINPLILLGPVVVAAGHEGRGIATALMCASLAAIDADGGLPVLLIGDVPFYGRFGFAAHATQGWQLPGPVDHARLLLRGAADTLPRTAWVEAAAPTVKVA